MLTSRVHLPGASLASVGLGGLLYFLAARRQVVMRTVLFTWVPSWMRKGAAAQLDVFLKWFLELDSVTFSTTMPLFIRFLRFFHALRFCLLCVALTVPFSIVLIRVRQRGVLFIKL